MSVKAPKIPIISVKPKPAPRKCIDCPALIRIQRGGRCKPCQDDYRQKKEREKAREKYLKRKARKEVN